MEQKITALQGENEQTAATLKDVERRLSDMALLIKNITTYKELKPLYDEYKKSRDKEKYLRGHESEIILFEVAAKALKASGVSGKLPDPAKLKAEYKRLTAEKDALYTEYGKLKSSSENTMPSSRISTVFCTLPVGANRKKRCNCSDSHTLFTNNLMCNCRSCIDNDTLFLYNMMCISQK